MFQNQQARICMLYLPLVELLYQNLKQLSAQPYTSSPGLGLNVSPLWTLDIHGGLLGAFLTQWESWVICTWWKANFGSKRCTLLNVMTSVANPLGEFTVTISWTLHLDHSDSLLKSNLKQLFSYVTVCILTATKFLLLPSCGCPGLQRWPDINRFHRYQENQHCNWERPRWVQSRGCCTVHMASALFLFTDHPLSSPQRPSAPQLHMQCFHNTTWSISSTLSESRSCVPDMCHSDRAVSLFVCYFCLWIVCDNRLWWWIHFNLYTIHQWPGWIIVVNMRVLWKILSCKNASMLNVNSPAT